MTKDKTVTMSRELAERVQSALLSSHCPEQFLLNELQRAIAAPIVEADGMGEAVLLGKGFTTLESCEGKYRIITAYQDRDDAWSDYKALCKAQQPAPAAFPGYPPVPEDRKIPESPPAPVAVVLLLEWSEISDPTEECRYTHVTAKTAIGTYSIEWKAHKQFDDRTLFLDGDHVSSGHDLAEAKAKAQEHHCARVIACLYKPKEPTQ